MAQKATRKTRCDRQIRLKIQDCSPYIAVCKDSATGPGHSVGMSLWLVKQIKMSLSIIWAGPGSMARSLNRGSSFQRPGTAWGRSPQIIAVAVIPDMEFVRGRGIIKAHLKERSKVLRKLIKDQLNRQFAWNSMTKSMSHLCDQGLWIPTKHIPQSSTVSL